LTILNGMQIKSMSVKRIVVQGLNGLHKIIGYMEVPPHVQFAARLETADFATVVFANVFPRYVVYKEIE